MVNRRSSIRLLGALALLGMLVLPAPEVHAAITRGMTAAEIDARDPDTNASVLLASLRGRMVLLEFFGTDCPHCQRLAPRMNAIHRTYASRGLVVLGLTPDAREKALRFRAAHGTRHAIALAPMDALREYAVKEYPLGVLVSPNGRVLWRGRMERMTDRVLDAYLGRVGILPDPPRTFTLVRDALERQRYGEAERMLERLRACRGIDRTTCRYVLDTLDWIAWHKESAFAAAAEDVGRMRWSMAWHAYAELELAYAGSPEAARAAKAKAALMDDARQAKEIRAGYALTQARRRGRWQPLSRQIELLRAVAEAHPGTLAGTQALAIVRLLTQS